MSERKREIRRRRARHKKTKWLKARIAATSDSRRKMKLIDKLRKVNPFLTAEDLDL